MKTIWPALVGTAMLAGCGSPTGDKNVAPAATPDPVEAKINALNDNMRKVAFYKAIYDAGYSCHEIAKVDTLPRDSGKASWRATCDDGLDYVITLQPGGVFLVSGVPQTGPRFRPSRPPATPTPAP